MTDPLVLWDVDHTLLYAGDVGRAVFPRVFRTLTGAELTQPADMAGRTDRWILTETMTLNGYAGDHRRDEFFAEMVRVFDELRDHMLEHGRVLPGAKEAVAALAGRGAVQTLVTGNLPGVAAIKMDVFGFTGLDLEIGGYGMDHLTRAPMMHASVELAGAKYGELSPVVVGDTPHDVTGAQEAGLPVIAVATGRFPVEVLGEYAPDVLLPDLADTAAVVRAVELLTGPTGPSSLGRPRAQQPR